MSWIQHTASSAMGSGSHKVPHVLVFTLCNFEGVKVDLPVFKNSTDLDRVRRPELKSVEFFKIILPCHDISSLLCDIVGERMLQLELMGAGPRAACISWRSRV